MLEQPSPTLTPYEQALYWLLYPVPQFSPFARWGNAEHLPGVTRLNFTEVGAPRVEEEKPLDVLAGVTKDLYDDPRFTIKLLYVFEYTDASFVRQAAERFRSNRHWAPRVAVLDYAYANNLIGRSGEWALRLQHYMQHASHAG